MCKKSDDIVIRMGLGELEIEYQCASFKRYVEISWSGCYNEGFLNCRMFAVQSFSVGAVLLLLVYAVYPMVNVRVWRLVSFPNPSPMAFPPSGPM